MSRNEDFDNGIWSNPDFEELSRDAAWLYIWSWTNPRCDMSGVYRVGRRAMTESRVELAGLDAALDELARAHFAYYEEGVLWVRSRVRRLRSKSPKMAISVARDFAKLSPEHPLHHRWLELYGSDAWLREALRAALQTLSKGSPEVPFAARETGDLGNLPPTSPDPLAMFHRTGTGTGSPKDFADLPSELVDRLHPVLAVLTRVQAERGGEVPTLRGVALGLAAEPGRDHLAVAHALEHWALAGGGRTRTVRDWVRTYRTFLAGAADLPVARAGAGVPARGTPAVAHTGDLSRFDRIERRGDR
ncbi:MAG TPA: hypothetical protein VE972_15030 [Conexibacter sp.]|nr:hypothetical protein [Conexibacter sp.]